MDPVLESVNIYIVIELELVDLVIVVRGIGDPALESVNSVLKLKISVFSLMSSVVLCPVVVTSCPLLSFCLGFFLSFRHVVFSFMLLLG